MTFLMLTIALLFAQSRDATAPLTGTAVLSGVVVSDEQTPRPLGRTTVTLVSSGVNRSSQTAATDDRGRFSFANLPPGNFTLFATKPAYVTTYFGAKRPGAMVGVPIALTDGQRMTGVTLRMPRGGVITGTVSDEAGRPMASVAVRVRQVTRSAGGGRTFSNLTGVAAPTTDDRGQYRVFGLPPGEYVVAIQPRITGTGELRQTSSAELQWAEQQLRSTTGGATPNATNAATPAPGPTVTYASVFYPGTADESAATVIGIGSGQERAGIDIRAQFVATARVEGTVLDPNGQPASGLQVMLLPHESSSSAVTGLSGSASDLGRLMLLSEVGLIGASTGARTTGAGAFSIAGVAPGTYSLMASTVAATRPGPARGTGPSAPALWAMTDVTVNGQDVSGITLRLAPGMNVSGRLAFQGAAPADQSRIAVTLMSVQSGSSVFGNVTLNLTDPVFSVSGVAPGHYRLGATLGAWTLASAMLNGRDVADMPFEIKPGEDVSNIVVTFTDNPAEVTGILTDAAGRPAPGFMLMLFTTDRALWYPGSRRLNAPIGPASDGRFTFKTLAPGEYFLAAVTDVTQAEATDPAFLEQVALSAIRITVAAGEKKEQNLRVAGR